MLQNTWKLFLVTFSIFSLQFVTSCSEEAVPPTAEQASALTKTIRECKKIARTQPRLSHLAEYRNRFGVSFTCEDAERECNINYMGDHCESTKIVIAVETAVEKKCRRNTAASSSAACSTLTNACNVKGFQSDECMTAIQPYLP